MKKQKLIAALDERKHKIGFPTDGEFDAFETFTRELRDAVIDNLEALTSAERYEARKSWSFNPGDRSYAFEISISLAVEVENEIEAKRTHHSVVHVRFNCWPLAAKLDTVIDALDTDIRRFKKGLAEMRKLQLQRILTNEGADAYSNAIDRGH